MKPLLLSFLLLLSGTTFATTWLVGASRTYTVPSQVAGLVQNGDTVLIDPGTYTDCANWSKSNLLLRGTGPGYSHCETAVCGSKGIWVFNAGANNITVENMEFSGASISGGSGGNGAGIRAQGGSYTIRHCYFHNNQNGILCNPTTGNDSADVLIEYSTFAYNGCPSGDASGCTPGLEHNMYIGSGYRSFTLQYSYTHGAIIGHNIKTRANNNYILYNRIMDLSDGTSSYDIDLAQGGATVIMGNLVEAGPHKTNHSIITYNEGSTNAGPLNLYIINNTIVNDQSTGAFLYDPIAGNDTLFLFNNIMAGPGTMFNGAANFAVIDSSHNLITTSIPGVGLTNAASYDYHLTSTSPAIDAGTGVGYVYDISTSLSLTPVAQYVDSATTQARITSGSAIDEGGYEFLQSEPLTVSQGVINPSCNSTNDGTIYDTITGGAPPYYIYYRNRDSIAGIQDTVTGSVNVITGLVAGHYIVEVHDSAENFLMLQAIVTAPPKLSAQVVLSSNTLCGDTGILASFYAVGGRPPYYGSWLPAGNIDPWFDDSVTIFDSGPLQLYVIDYNGCSVIVDTTIYSCITAIQSLTTNAFDAIISPNPSDGNFTVLLQNLSGSANIQLYNTNGQLITRQQTYTGNRLLSFNQNLPAGMYLIRIENAEGAIMKRVVVER